jgi:hypothetical protein
MDDDLEAAVIAAHREDEVLFDQLFGDERESFGADGLTNLDNGAMPVLGEGLGHGFFGGDFQLDEGFADALTIVEAEFRCAVGIGLGD